MATKEPTAFPEVEKVEMANLAGSQASMEDEEPKMSFRRFMSFVAMAFLWTGSQIPVYLFGGVPPYIYGDIGGADRWIWFVLANLLSLAAVCPFVGNLSDLVGRRYVSLIGAAFLMVAMIISSTAKTMNIFICGMTLAGVGAGICELTALAVTSELAPVRKRGTYVAVLIFTIVPFCPSVLWGQLIAANHGWRYIGLLCGVWATVGFVMTAVFYNPPPRAISVGLTRSEVIKQIDFIGGFLSISGMILFMAGMQWGGYQYPWKSAHVLAPLILGGVLLIAFYLWEAYGTDHPMFPARLKQDPRVLLLTLIITFISGANFFSVLMFWPTQAFNVYGHDPVGVGIRGIPVGFGILAGAVICLVLLSVFRGKNRELMIAASVLMTAGCGSLAVADINNLGTLWGLLVLASLGIGGIVVPASIMTTIICPDDLIATVAALTLAIRVIGGSIGYCVYYNVYVSKFRPHAITYIGGAIVRMGIKDPMVIKEAIVLTGESMLSELHHLPGIAGNETRYQILVKAGQMAFAESYKYVYLVSIAFGAVSIVAACLLGDISKYMDNHVAVVME
ncbi:MFS drug efflux pump [Pyronema domesticum]|uniref:Similar to Putative HC-toxin efflux carrier TOXA acc. no. Q00357 n=1 Tax=Pyronema omphalodes (strain CBS 100304) TaxID=1076935 RepID=U4L7T8_PYROM|nr:MFS drug efflux pump [Pyronema domesticum]CCX09243.1 Similar to Putative HC-toxin efflux carrier TOXA; acc. no. Q00357 [Pyronema omphalodes CBS 100304]